MRRFVFIISALLLCTGTAQAQQWYTTNQATLAWDAVTKLVDGRPLPEGNVIQYKVYLANAVTDSGKTNPIEVGTGIVETRYVITLNQEGKYFVGIRAVRIVGGEAVAQSEVTWADDPASNPQPGPFGLRFFESPGAVGGHRIVQ